MVPKELRVSGTYLLCSGNRIHKFRIKWCSKSTPTAEQVHEVMQVTEDIIKSNNLPRRIITGQLKIITKISFWTPRSKALSLRQFRSEKQGCLSAHKHSYVLLVFLADHKEEQGCEHLSTSVCEQDKDGLENEALPVNVEKEVVESGSSISEHVQMAGIQSSTKEADAVEHNDKPACRNQICLEESVEAILNTYEREQQCFPKSNEDEYNFVSKIERLVEKACMAAKIIQNQAVINGHDNEQHASKEETSTTETDIVAFSGSTESLMELHRDSEAEHTEAIHSLNFCKNSSFPVMDTKTACTYKANITVDKCEKHSSTVNKLPAGHLQVVTAHCKLGNIRVSTNSSTDMFDTSEDAICKDCSASNIHVPKLPVDVKEGNTESILRVCEVPLAVSPYITHTHDNVSVTQNYNLPYVESKRSEEITVNVAIRRKRCHRREENGMYEICNKKRAISGDLSPVVLGPTSFQECCPCHTGVMSEYRALKTFESILSEGRNKTEASLPNFTERLENWLANHSVISRLKAVSKVNSDEELKNILRYIIRNLRNRSANMTFVQENEGTVFSTSALWTCDTPANHRTQRALSMTSEGNETVLQGVSKEAWQSTGGKLGAGNYINSSIVHIKTDSTIDSGEDQQTSYDLHRSQELEKYNAIVSIKQEPKEECDSISVVCDTTKPRGQAVEPIGESADVLNVKVGPTDTGNNQELDAERAEKQTQMVKENNSHFKYTATSENSPEGKNKFEVKLTDVVHIISLGDGYCGIVKPSCTATKEEINLRRRKKPVQVSYDEICIPNVLYTRLSQFSTTSTMKKKENIGCSNVPVAPRSDNAVDTMSNTSHLQFNSSVKMNKGSLAKHIPNQSINMSSDEILENATPELYSLKELCTIPSIRQLRKTLIQQGVLEVLDGKRLSLRHPQPSVSSCSHDFSKQCLSSLNNIKEVPFKLSTGTNKSAPHNYSTLDKCQYSFDSDALHPSKTDGSSSDAYSSALQDSALNNCHIKIFSQNFRRGSFETKSALENFILPEPTVPLTYSKVTEMTKPLRVKIGELLTCSKSRIFLTSDIYVDGLRAHSQSMVSHLKPRCITPKSPQSSNMISYFLQSMAFYSTQNTYSTFNSQCDIPNPSPRYKIYCRKNLQTTSAIPHVDCVVNSSKISQSEAYNFSKSECHLDETSAKSISPAFPHCKCPPSVKFSGMSASFSLMSTEHNTRSPRQQLIDMIHNIKSGVQDRRNTCHGQHCFYFQVDKEESVEGFYSTVEKYCSALIKFHNNHFSSSQTREILLRDIWLPGQKYSMSFCVNLPVQKCKCSHCGLEATVELCLNCGELFERTECGDYVPFEYQKTPAHEDMKMEMNETTAKVLNLINDLHLCKPVVVMQQMKQNDTIASKQNKISLRKKKKRKQTCCRASV